MPSLGTSGCKPPGVCLAFLVAPLMGGPGVPPRSADMRHQATTQQYDPCFWWQPRRWWSAPNEGDLGPAEVVDRCLG